MAIEKSEQAIENAGLLVEKLSALTGMTVAIEKVAYAEARDYALTLNITIADPSTGKPPADVEAPARLITKAIKGANAMLGQIASFSVDTQKNTGTLMLKPENLETLIDYVEHYRPAFDQSATFPLTPGEPSRVATKPSIFPFTPGQPGVATDDSLGR